MLRNSLHSYTLIMKDQKLRKQSHLQLQKVIKCAGINVSKETEGLYS